MKDFKDKTSILHDISERKRIIDQYTKTGYLDRAHAIATIQTLRFTDPEVAQVTQERLLISAVPFDQVSDQGLIDELRMQLGVLVRKLEDE